MPIIVCVSANFLYVSVQVVFVSGITPAAFVLSAAQWSQQCKWIGLDVTAGVWMEQIVWEPMLIPLSQAYTHTHTHTP